MKFTAGMQVGLGTAIAGLAGFADHVCSPIYRPGGFLMGMGLGILAGLMTAHGIGRFVHDQIEMMKR